jgi:hypothetical protein
MANFNPTTSLAFPLTRQTLYNAFADAALGTVSTDDLVEGLLSADRVSSLTQASNNVPPGFHVFSQAEQIMYVWHDEIEDTGVSLFLAIGPDRFDTACIAAEPIPAGAPVEVVYDRWVRCATAASEAAYVKAIGCNQAGVDLTSSITQETTSSGAWFPVGIDGLMYMNVQAGDDVTANRFVEVSPTGPGVRQLSTASFAPDRDTVIGYAPFAVANSGDSLPKTNRVIWMNHRLWRAFI